MTKGHTRGTSYSKKKFDRLKQRNYYAKDLLDPKGNHRPKVIPDKRWSPKKLLDYLEDLDEKNQN